MPDDSNGIYNVPSGTLVNTGDTVLPSQHNPWALDSSQAISNRFSKDGRSPATGNWNLNTFRITGMGDGVSATDAVTKHQVETALDQKLSKSGGTLTGDLLFGPGTSGRYSKVQANGDVQLNRGDNTGFNTWNAPNAYFGWDGGRYVFGPAGGLVAYGYLQVDGPGLSSKLGPSGDIDFSGFMNTEFGPYLSTALRGFKSGNQPYVTNGSGSVGHGLGRKPSKLSAYLVCTTAQDGWAVGDEMEVGAFNYFNNASYGITFWADATNIYWRLAANGLVLISKVNGTTFVAAPANFALRLRGSL